jgi:hypothetical protein
VRKRKERKREERERQRGRERERERERERKRRREERGRKGVHPPGLSSLHQPGRSTWRWRWASRLNVLNCSLIFSSSKCYFADLALP